MRKLLLAVLGLGAALAQEINPQGIIVNPVPTDLEVQVWVDKDPAKRGNAVYRIGESIYIYVRVNQDAYVYLFNINADGRIDPILPNPYERDNFLRAGETRRFPPEGARYRYTITGPEGRTGSWRWRAAAPSPWRRSWTWSGARCGSRAGRAWPAPSPSSSSRFPPRTG